MTVKTKWFYSKYKRGKNILLPEGTRLRRAYDLFTLAILEGIGITTTPASDSVSSSSPTPSPTHDIHSDNATSEDITAYDYSMWLAKNEPTITTLKWMNRISQEFPYKPSFAVCINIYYLSENVYEESIKSVREQCYPEWKLYIVCTLEIAEKVISQNKDLVDNSKLDIIVRDVKEETSEITFQGKEFIIFIRAGDVLRPYALFEIAQRLNIKRDIDILYADHDYLLSDGKRVDPFFKPDWSPDLFLGMNYIGNFYTIKKSLYDRIGGLRYQFTPHELYDLLLRSVEESQCIDHISKVLYSTRKETILSDLPDTLQKVLGSAMERRGTEAEILPINSNGNQLRIKYRICGMPKVSIIILTALKKSPSSDGEFYIEKCLKSVVNQTSYSNYEVIIVDNSEEGLKESEVKGWLYKRTPYNILRYKDIFNFAKMNNWASMQASGDYFLFLNDDTEVISKDWLEAMLEHAQRPDVGVVGAKLLYPDGSIQHAGMFLVDYGGGARHAFRHLPGSSDGYFGLLKLVRDCSAVTGACFMVERNILKKLGGFDETYRVECNDTDFCLRAIEAGYVIVWTPFAVLYHHEFGTRTETNVSRDTTYFWNSWRTRLEKGDTYYNPNLAMDRDDYSINLRQVLIEHHEPLEIDPEEVDRILIIKLDHLGDVITCIPAIKMLREKFTKAHITMLVGPFAKPLVEMISEVDEILTFDLFREKSSEPIRILSDEEKKKISQWLSGFRFDLAIDLRRHPESREMLKLASARYTVGYTTDQYYKDFGDEWMTVCLPLSERIKDIALQSSKPHISDQLCQLVRAIPLKQSIIPINLSYLKTNYNNRNLFSFKTSLIIGIHPGSGNPIKEWPPLYFSRLMDLLIQRNEASIVIFGGGDDVQTAQSIIEQMKYYNEDRVLSLAGKLSLKEFTDGITSCHLFIGNDSGPAHIAAAQGVPTFIIWSGIVPSQERVPTGLKTWCIRTALSCSPCYSNKHELCAYDIRCLKNLWPEKVWEAVQQALIFCKTNITQ